MPLGGHHDRFMPVVLSDTEVDVLLWALDQYLPQLRYDAARVKVERYRHEVVLREEVLTTLRDRLALSAAVRAEARAGDRP